MKESKFARPDLAMLELSSPHARTILDNKYLVDWEQPDNEDNPVLILVEPKG